MKALLVYESLFGNTEAVARAIADGLSLEMEVAVHEVGEAPTAITEFIDLVVVGGPTHAFSLSRPGTRVEAVRQGAPEERATTGLREWLGHLRKGPHSELVATFDTRADRVRHLPGSAARKAEHVLRGRGYAAIGHESFYVSDTAGPLVAGELDRAREWGRALGEDMRARHDGRAPSRRT